MYEIDTLVNNMFGINDAFFRSFDNLGAIAKSGFSKILKRPHNLIDVLDDTNEVIAQKIEVVTTPFKKDEVKVTIRGNTITVKCGSENKCANDNESYVYHGISSQSYTFSLRIPETTDKSKISAENKDGILTITMPIMKKKEDEEIEIKIS